jgi:hypothetical protein
MPSRIKTTSPHPQQSAPADSPWFRALSVAVLSAALHGCDDSPERTRSYFVGSTALLAADEPGSLLYERDYRDRPSDLSIAVLAGDVVASFGLLELFNPFGSGAATVVHLDAAPAGQRATLELRHRDVPLSRIDVEYAREGVGGFMSLPALAEQTPSLDPLGAVCVLEGQDVYTLVARRAADGRLLDAVLPVRTDVDSSSFTIDMYPAGFGAGVHVASFRAPDAGTYQVELVSRDDDRTWTAELRVVREDELVTLDLQTPGEDGLIADTLVAVVRTADGCPVLGPMLTLEVGDESVSRLSGWDGAYGTGLVPGAEVRAVWGDLVATAVY